MMTMFFFLLYSIKWPQKVKTHTFLRSVICIGVWGCEFVISAPDMYLSSISIIVKLSSRNFHKSNSTTWKLVFKSLMVHRFAVVTARLAKRAKVIFSLCVSVHGGGVLSHSALEVLEPPPQKNIGPWDPPPENIGPWDPPPPRPRSPPKMATKNGDKKMATKKNGDKMATKKWRQKNGDKKKMATKKNGDKKMAKKKMATKKWRRKGGGRGRYASCGHAGGLSCLY